MSNAFPASPAGRIATDPKLVAGANPRLNFRLAVDDRAQGPDGQWITKQTVFHDVVVFGRSAETFARLFRKGDPVIVAGELRLTTYESQGGDKRTGTQIVARLVAPDPRLVTVTIDRSRQADRAAGVDAPSQEAEQPATVPAPPPPPAADTHSRPRWPQQATSTAGNGVAV
ncbi:single-stranded DNA-binding protein [Jiangella sp. DSM 45060]|uniref:single-stranded DNA-binding protein n=1 Tax=Jiangella sp. DSM 45060 TaxID=1798224 RepID=UPI00087B18E2|nr:single-stranded DNA-binding protein [Jiangella sp. DSM 45060]SDT36556.1 single-strand DNA-binding protein [Jiangella sp. DSM 45060]